MNRHVLKVPLLILILMIWAGGSFASQETAQPIAGGGWMSLVSPAENALVVARKPTIKGSFLKEVVPESIVIYIDGTDYTAIAAKTSGGFEVTPPLPLPPGNHQVQVMAQDREGQAQSYTASFSSRHTNAFEEVGSNNHLTATYDYILKEPSSLDNTTSDWTVEANLTTSNVLRNGPWKFSLDGVARYKDQELEITAPERRGADVISYTAKGGYEKNGVKAEAAAGDLIIEQTPYTVTGLGRRGVALSGDVGFFAFDLFSVRGDTVYGTRGGLSADGGTDRHIRGGSGTIRLFSNRVALKTVYVDGGDPGGSYNIGTTGGGIEGKVLGFRLTTDFFTGKIITDFEIDFSEFNPDTSLPGDNVRDDHAIRAGINGAAGIFTYDAIFEYVGRDYEVVGNQWLAKNREGGRVGGAANFGTQTLDLHVSRYNDNVKNDPSLPVNVYWEANLLYGLNRWPSLPIWITYKFGHQESEDVAGALEETLDTISHDVNGQVSYTTGIFLTSLSGGYSKTDDRTAVNADSTAWNLRLAPGFTWPTLTLTPSAAYNETLLGQLRTETTTLGLDGMAQFFQSRVTAEVGGSWVFTRTSDGSQDNRSLNGSFRIAYSPGPLLSGYFVPTVAFRGQYDRLDDKITPASDQDNLTLFLTLTAEIPVVL
jgi:hypothetical protein